MELDERLASGERGRLGAPTLLRRGDRQRARGARLAGGRAGSSRARSPIWSRCGSTGSGSPGATPETALESVVFARRRRRRATGSICGGREIVRDGVHLELDVAARAARIDRGGDAMSALAIDQIGLLVTNDPELGEGPLGIVRDAALVIEDETVVGGRARRRRRATSDSTPAGAA